MKERKLILDQIDRKLIKFMEFDDMVIPPKGWIYSIRKALIISMRQPGNRMGITPQAVKDIENREESGSVSIRILKKAGIYGIITELHLWAVAHL